MIDLELITADFDKVIRRKLQQLPKAKAESLKALGFAIERTAKEQLRPGHGKKKGHLRASIRTHDETAPRGYVLVGVHISYGKFVERGIGASPGRYVPFLGKRLINPSHPSFGMHPGFPGIHFMEIAERKVKQRAPQIISKNFIRVFGA